MYYDSISGHEMARLLGLSLWGYSPCGALRVGKADDFQPTFTMTENELCAMFWDKFKRVPYRKSDKVFDVISRATGE